MIKFLCVVVVKGRLCMCLMLDLLYLTICFYKISHLFFLVEYNNITYIYFDTLPRPK